MPHDLFTQPARESICRYLAASSEPLKLILENWLPTEDRTGYTYRFLTQRGGRVTDGHVWTNFVAEVIKWPGGIGTPTYNAVLDVTCTKELVDGGEPPICFIEPFFADLGRRLLLEHHAIQCRGPRPTSTPRDPDLWAEFLLQVRRAHRKHDAAALGAFLVGPYAMLTTTVS